MSPAREPVETTAKVRRPTLPEELWAFLAANQKWWLLPVLIVISLVGGLVVLGSTVAAPFIYPLF